MQPTRVECYAGASYPERPRAFTWQGERLTVEAVLSGWYEPRGPGFRVRASDGSVFLLQYTSGEDAWRAAQIDSGSTHTVKKE